MIEKQYIPLVATIAGISALVIFCGCGGLIGLLAISGGSKTSEQAAIQRILDADHELSTANVVGSTPSEIANGVRVYVSKANALDMNECPADFKLAYRRHVKAWSRAGNAIDELPDGIVDAVFIGAINSLLRGELDGGQSRLEGGLAAADNEIRETWYAVEDIALSHGVAR